MRTENPQKILLVEDDEPLAGSAITLLELIGHQVEWARSATSADTMLRELRPDVIITDYDLGDGTGNELLAGVLSRMTSDRAMETLLILWSGNDRQASIDRAGIGRGAARGNGVEFVLKGIGALDRIIDLIERP